MAGRFGWLCYEIVVDFYRCIYAHDVATSVPHILPSDVCTFYCELGLWHVGPVLLRQWVVNANHHVISLYICNRELAALARIGRAQ